MLYLKRNTEDMFRHYLRFRYLFHFVGVFSTLVILHASNSLNLLEAALPGGLMLLVEFILMALTWKYLVTEENDEGLTELRKYYKDKVS